MKGRLLLGLAAGFAAGVAAVLLAGVARAAPSAPPRDTSREVTAELRVRITPEMIRYSNTRYALYFASALINALALLFLLESRASARLREFAERRSRSPLLRAYVHVPLLLLAYGLLTLPLSFYATFLLPRQYGLSTQTLGRWVLDGVKGFALSATILPPVAALLLWIVRRSEGGRGWPWWVLFWLASIPLTIFLVFVSPLVIDPLFNRFRPLQNERLRQRITALAERAGIERSRVFEVDASRRTRTVNAYVTGIGGSARIVLWDTLLRRLEEREVLVVTAHEIGHYVERHVVIGLLLGILGSLGALFVGDRLARAWLARRGAAWGVRGLDDPAALPALVLALSLLGFFSSPVESAISRTLERRADRFALELTGDGRAAASAFVKLSEFNLSHPSPPAFIEFWLFSHPPLEERIRTALAWPGRE